MKHSRIDYVEIQDPRGLIPEDEPVFLLRAQDKNAPITLEFWVREARLSGVPEDVCAEVDKHIQLMYSWQMDNGYKIPDL